MSVNVLLSCNKLQAFFGIFSFKDCNLANHASTSCTNLIPDLRTTVLFSDESPGVIADPDKREIEGFRPAFPLQ